MVLTKKVEVFKGKRFIITRKDGRFFKFKKFRLSKAARKKISIARRKKIPFLRQRADNIRKARPKARNIRKSDIEKGVRLTNVTEIKTEQPLLRQKSQLQLRVLFISETGDTADVTGRSNLMFISSNYNEAFNQAYKRALAQIAFTPIDVRLIDVKFVSWVK